MILAMASGRRLKLVVIPSETPSEEGRRRLRAGGADVPHDSDADSARWDDESPGH